MSANLNLLPRRIFELVLTDGSVVQGQFGTWALARFGQKKKIGLSNIIDLFTGADAQIQDMIEFILCAIEYKEREQGKPLEFNDLKLCKWIDDYSEDTGETGVLQKLFSHASDGAKETEEKKTNEQGLSGTSSSESSTQPV